MPPNRRLQPTAAGAILSRRGWSGDVRQSRWGDIMQPIASCAALVVVVSISVAAQGPPPPRRLPPAGHMATASATQPASSAAMVTWVTRYGHDGVHMLELLVVWRGKAGWFTRTGPRTSSSGGSGSVFHSSSRFGDVELQLSLDSAARTAEVQGQRIDLGDSNVLLVDEVDTADSAKVIAKLRVGPALVMINDRLPDVDGVLIKSAEVVSFLQCDVPTPAVSGSAVPWPTCGRLLGK